MPAMDHLTVVHRVPSRLLQDVSRPEDEIELPDELDYSMFRSLVEYSYPKGGNGSVIYETPPGLNARVGEGKSSNTLTFTCQMVVSEQLNTHLVLINYSTNPGYSQIARYGYAIHALSGERVVTDHVDIGPFAIRVLDVAHVIPEDILARCTDPQDDLATFTLTGYSEDAAIMVVVLNTAPSLGAVALEHTHPPQSYLFPVDLGYHRQAKNDAQKAWNSIMSRNAGG